MPYGYDPATGILSGLSKILLAVSLIGLVTGFAMYIKDILFKKETVNNKAECSDTACKTGGAESKEKCSSCGRELKTEWKCCPICGGERASAEKISEVNDYAENNVENVNIEETKIEANNEEINISAADSAESSEEVKAAAEDSVETNEERRIPAAQNTDSTDEKDPVLTASALKNRKKNRKRQTDK